MNKKDLLFNLHNVKIVLGNGFDLHCGLKSRYQDFYNYSDERSKRCWMVINACNDWLSLHSRIKLQQVNWLFSSCKYSDFLLSKTTIWDYFFYINQKIDNGKEVLWQDVENMINDTLQKYVYVNWDYVKELIRDQLYNNHSVDNISEGIIACLLYKKYKERVVDENCFYDCVLDELKQFEKNFGEYIELMRNSEECNNNKFEDKCTKTILNLCSFGEISSIDSFNYDNLGNIELDKKLHNINGVIDSPIFGIDSEAFNALDPRFVFTKTNRRMELDMFSNNSRKIDVFDNVIVYGHSLCENDYSYFFPLFDKLELYNFSSNKKIVFAFSVYDKNKESDIKNKYRKAIQNIFIKYAEYRGLSNQKNRLLDSLTIHNRVIIYELPDDE